MPADHGFELLREQFISELNTHARLFRHIKTGAELLSMENDDENKVFGITFRTPVEDSTGVAHILEHSVLCGSRKYPVKDPFIKMAKSSLKTFLNAMTYPDRTCYPVASTNLQDFYNLMDVYLDAVFFPRITPEILQQEGWHYELEAADAPLIYKGVVFNEMKGAYAAPERRLFIENMRSLFPETTYRYDSGGDPQEIPNLSYTQFKRFHETLYHPSNSRIYFWGDDDPQERLRRLDEYLSAFSAIEVQSEVPLQPRNAQPRQIQLSYASGEQTERKAMVAVNWLLDELRDETLALALDVLNEILAGTAGSPLRKALIDSGLGEDLTGAGYVDYLRQPYFSAGLKGIAPESAAAVEQLILNTLSELATRGIEQPLIEAALNTVEFSLRENNTGSMPRGLVMMFRALRNWVYGADPLAPLVFEAPLAELKQRLAAGERVFEQILQQTLLENPHRSTVLLTPDPQQGQREAAAEQNRLDTMRRSLNDQQLGELVELTRELKRQQGLPDAPEAVATLPMLRVEDLERQNKIIPLELLPYGETQVLYHDLFTNGIVYLEAALDLRQLPAELMPYLSLFGRGLTELGTEQEDYVQLALRIGRKTGGVYATSFTSVVRDSGESTGWLVLRGKAMNEQAGELLAILRDVLLTVKLDNRERLRQMVLEEKAGVESSLPRSGHSYASSRLNARLTSVGRVSESMGGISYLFFLRELARRIDEDWPAVLAELQQVHAALINRNALVCNVTLDSTNWQQFQPQLHGFIDSLPAAPVQRQQWPAALQLPNEGLLIPSQVNYVGKAVNLYESGYRLHGSIQVILKQLRNAYLWENVRVLGGAYGAMAGFDSRSGVLGFYSYRDPNLLGTLDVYREIIRYLRESEFSREELSGAIIGTIGDIDGYQLPDAKGYSSMLRYLAGDTEELRQRLREEVLDTSIEDFRDFADVLERAEPQALITVVGGSAAIEGANHEQPGLLEPVRVL